MKRRLSVFSIVSVLIVFSLPGIAFGASSMVLNPSGGVIEEHGLKILVNPDATETVLFATITNLGPSNWMASTPLTVNLVKTPDCQNLFCETVLITNEFAESDPDAGIWQFSAARGDTLLVSVDGVPDKAVSVVSIDQTTNATGSRQVIDENYAQSCIDNNGDNDTVTDPNLPNLPVGDGICDLWEVIDGEGKSWINVTDNSGNLLYSYECEGDASTPTKKACGPGVHDFFLEIDWMEGHPPDTNAISAVIQAFSWHGINLHIQYDKGPNDFAIGHDPDIIMPGYQIDGLDEKRGFDQIKGNNFGTIAERTESGTVTVWDENNPKRIGKHQIFRYCLFIHEREGYIGQSGTSEMNGNDCLISMGSYTNSVGSVDQQAGTLMHEIGHMLGLKHGGLDWINHKPNYFSVMSYSRQMADYDADRVIDFSDTALDDNNSGVGLSELKLDDPNGMELYAKHTGFPIVYSCPDGQMGYLIYFTGGDVDWDCDDDLTEVDRPANINNLPSEPNNKQNDVLKGWSDWEALNFKFWDDSDFVDGVHIGDSAMSGIAGGEKPPFWTDLPGIPPFETVDSLKERLGVETLAECNEPGRPGPDCGVQYATVTDPDYGGELTIEDVISSRISNALLLYREIESMPPEVFDSLMNGDPLPVSLDSNHKDFSPDTIYFVSQEPTNVQLSYNLTKQDFKNTIKDIIQATNYHDLNRTLDLLDQIKYALKNSPNQKAFGNSFIITQNMIDATKTALNFTPTSIHDSSTHHPTLYPIVEPTKVGYMIKEVEIFVSTLNLADWDKDGIPNKFDECPKDDFAFEDPCIDDGHTKSDEKPMIAIPEWIKNNAGWWADGSIDDKSFVQGMQWLIQEGIIKIPPTTQGKDIGNEIPDWIKNNAGWWADGSIDDTAFVQGMQWLIQEGIMKISTTTTLR